MKHNALTLFALLATASVANAKLVSREVPYEHNGVKLEGYLAYDDEKSAPGKSAGILVVPEWWGLNSYVKSRANQLAQLGYVAFVADMYGKGVVTEDPKKAEELVAPFEGKPLMAERAQAGLNQLRKLELVDKSKVAAIGFCFGGSTIQALAYTGAPLKGIVSFHGGPVPAPASAKGKVQAKFLLLNGAIDKMVTPDARTELEKSLEAAGVDYQSIDYAHALHAFTNPGADKIAAEKDMKGMIGYDEAAARRSWKQMQIFFDEIFGTPSS
ncbi:MAG: dienelactone hydrolase family protein [Chthoniobacterales bacterium]